MTVPRILVIAGSDSGGGAGIQADVKAVTLLGGHAMTAITAITAQNTLGVRAVHPVPVDMVLAQMDAVAEDIGVDVVKIGMLGSAAIAGAVADWLERRPGVPVIFDPVMVATSGAALADGETIAAFARLMVRATLVTPNIPELAALADMAVEGAAQAEAAARLLAARCGAAILAKGGHMEGGELLDLLVMPGGGVHRWRSPRIDSRHTHGTGCTLASAIATGLGMGLDLPAAIGQARLHVRAAIEAAPGLGAGAGPMGVPRRDR